MYLEGRGTSPGVVRPTRVGTVVGDLRQPGSPQGTESTLGPGQGVSLGTSKTQTHLPCTPTPPVSTHVGTTFPLTRSPASFHPGCTCPHLPSSVHLRDTQKTKKKDLRSPVTTRRVLVGSRSPLVSPLAPLGSPLVPWVDSRDPGRGRDVVGGMVVGDASPSPGVLTSVSGVPTTGLPVCRREPGVTVPTGPRGTVVSSTHDLCPEGGGGSFSLPPWGTHPVVETSLLPTPPTRLESLSYGFERRDPTGLVL